MRDGCFDDVEERVDVRLEDVVPLLCREVDDVFDGVLGAVVQNSAQKC